MKLERPIEEIVLIFKNEKYNNEHTPIKAHIAQ